MTILEAIILGIIQGLTEFIPISSTAHLTLAGHLMGLIDPNNPEKWTAFIAVIQLGTLLAVFIYFSNEVVQIPKSFLAENFRKSRIKYQNQSLNSKLGWLIIVGSVPIVLLGYVFKKFIEGEFTKEPIVIGISLILFAILLAIAERIAKFEKSIDKISIIDSLIIGLAQCIALIPGASRSGTTITAGLFLGLQRETAARFSFLLSMPAILASGILQFYQSLAYINIEDSLNIIVATIAAAISGYWSIAFLLKFLKTRSTMIFVIYRIIIGVIILTNL